MEKLLKTVKEFDRTSQPHHFPQAVIGLLIFCTSLFIYLSNGILISSGDNVPSSLIAFNWLFNQTLNFDAFRDSYLFRPFDCANCPATIPHYFAEAPNGHLTSAYPIGNAILSFPLYCLFFIVLQLSHASGFSGSSVPIPAITDANFEAYRQYYEMLAAAILTAASIVVFYLCAALKFHPSIALLITFIYGFATNTWVTSSQGLWQHTAANLALLCVLLCLLKANRTETDRNKLLWVAGFFCGLIPGCRPTSVLFAIAITVYCIFNYRQQVRWFGLGLLSFLFSSSWNFYYFGFSPENLLVAGYSRFSETSFTGSFYRFTPQQFGQGFVGLLINPNRGLLIYSPVVLFALPGLYRVWQSRWKKDEQLLGCLAIAAGLVFLQYCFFDIWWGGWCYGPRFLTDVLPIACFLIGYCIRDGQLQLQHQRRPLMGVAILCLSLVLSTSVQVVGTFGSTNWDGIPGIKEPNQTWTFQDTQIQRHTNRLRYRLTEAIDRPRQYLRRTDGVIQSVQIKGQPSLAEPEPATSGEKLILTAKIKNTGKTNWYGYETALIRGEARIQIRFLDSSGAIVPISANNLLYVSGRPEPREKTTAIGQIQVPTAPGTYQMRLTPILQRLGEFPKYKTGIRQPYQLPIVVANSK